MSATKKNFLHDLTFDQYLIDENCPIHYIDNIWHKGLNPSRHKLINPAHETSYGMINFASCEQAEQAIQAAKNAFPLWAKTTPQERLAYGETILKSYRERQEDMAKAISIEMGAPIDFAVNSQVKSGEENIEVFLNNFRDFSFERSLSKKENTSKLFLHPLGVAGLITPWNWPINQITLKVIAALLAGCTTILKPSELSPLSAIIFAQILENANLPAGVFNLIHGTGEDIGRYLAKHPDLSIVSFTGSTRAGRDISIQAAQNLTKVTLELGGKGANILLEDCDDKAIEREINGIIRNSGQSCNAPSRLLVPRKLYDKILQQAKDLIQNIKLDYSEKAGNHIGPLSSQKQYNHAIDLINSGIKEGAKLLCGGPDRPEDLPKGYYIRPTIFYDVTPKMRIFQEEIFGPVISIIPYETIEEAINLANNTIYGLTNYIQSQNKAKAVQLAKKLQSGMVEINGHSLPEDSFFGGIKASGHAREGGSFGIEEYCYMQAVSYP